MTATQTLIRITYAPTEKQNGRKPTLMVTYRMTVLMLRTEETITGARWWHMVKLKTTVTRTNTTEITVIDVPAVSVVTLRMLLPQAVLKAEVMTVVKVVIIRTSARHEKTTKSRPVSPDTPRETTLLTDPFRRWTEVKSVLKLRILLKKTLLTSI